MEVEDTAKAVEVEGAGASGNIKPWLRSHVKDNCSIIVEGMKVGLALHNCTNPEADLINTYSRLCMAASTLKLILHDGMIPEGGLESPPDP